MNTTLSTRAELKARAKDSLRGTYWFAFGFSILVSVLIGITRSIAQIPMQAAYESSETALFASLLSAGMSIFIVVPILIGEKRFFINLAKGEETQLDEMFYIFKNGFLNTVLVMLLQTVYVFLWSLLFFIPGIIKAYQYMMIDYMLAENPNMNHKRAFEITKATMTGDKWKAFVLGLSFIGWQLLCVVTFGIGFLFLSPYINATLSHYYLDLKEKAINNGIATTEDFKS